MDSFNKYYKNLCNLQSNLKHDSIFAHSTRDVFNKNRSESVVNIIRDNVVCTDTLTCIDMFCGQGAILQSINESFNNSKSIGIDISKFNDWSNIENDNCLFIQQNVFDTISIYPDFIFDVVITFNTLRADNQRWGIDRYESFLTWCRKNTRYLITNNCTYKQFAEFELVDTRQVVDQYDTNLFKNINYG